MPTPIGTNVNYIFFRSYSRAFKRRTTTTSVSSIAADQVSEVFTNLWFFLPCVDFRDLPTSKEPIYQLLLSSNQVNEKRDCVWVNSSVVAVAKSGNKYYCKRIMTLGKMDAMMICQFGFPLPRY